MSEAPFVEPPAVRPGDTVAIVAPASPFPEDAFAAGLAELRRIGFEPVAGARAFYRTGYVAGPAESRAAALQAAFEDPSSRAILAARGGYGSVELLPWLDAGVIRRSPKLLVGYSDITALLAFLTTHCGVVAAHGPCVAAGLHLGPAGYDVPTFVRTMTSLEPLGVLPAPRLDMGRDFGAAQPDAIHGERPGAFAFTRKQEATGKQTRHDVARPGFPASHRACSRSVDRPKRV